MSTGGLLRTESELVDLARTVRTMLPTGGSIGLIGELGVGKTAFARALVNLVARENSVPQIRVTSPSFAIHIAYTQIAPAVEHFDLYRLDNPGEADLDSTGVLNAVAGATLNRHYVLVEWPERISDYHRKFELLLRLTFDRAMMVRSFELKSRHS